MKKTHLDFLLFFFISLTDSSSLFASFPLKYRYKMINRYSYMLNTWVVPESLVHNSHAEFILNCIERIRWCSVPLRNSLLKLPSFTLNNLIIVPLFNKCIIISSLLLFPKLSRVDLPHGSFPSAKFYLNELWIHIFYYFLIDVFIIIFH